MVMIMAMITAAARTAIIAPIPIVLVLTGGSTECMSKEKKVMSCKKVDYRRPLSY